MTKILVATDGSDASREAGKIAINKIANEGDTIYATHILPTHKFTSPAGEVSRDLVKQYEDEGQKFVEDICSLCQGKNIECEQVLKKGVPATEIASLIKEKGIDQVVMGTVGQTGAEFFGGTTQRVIARSNVPVIVISTPKK